MPFYDRQDVQLNTKKNKQKNSFWSQVKTVVPKAINDITSNPIVKTVSDIYNPVNAVKDVGGVLNTLGTGYGNALGEITGVNNKAQTAVNNDLQDTQDTVSKLQTKLSDPTLSKDGKNKINAAIKTIRDNDQALLDKQAANLKSQQQATDPTKIGAASGELALDAVTGGVAGEAIKGGKAAVEGGLDIAKELNPAQKAAKALLRPTGGKESAISGSTIGATYGGLGSAEQNGKNTTVGDVIGDAIPGAILGGGLGALVGTLSKGIADTRNRPKSSLDDIKATELPFFQHTQRLTPEQQDKVTAALQSNPVLTNRALNMSEDEAKTFTDELIKGPKTVKTIKGGSSEITPRVPEEATNPFTQPRTQDIQSNTITPAQNPPTDLEAAATQENPGQFWQKRQQSTPVEPNTPVTVETPKLVPTVNQTTSDVSPDVSVVVKGKDGKSTAYSIPSDQKDDIVNAIDNNRTENGDVAPSAGVPTDNGIYHIQARSKDNLVNQFNMKDGGIFDTLQHVPTQSVKTMAAEVTPQADIGEINMDLTPSEMASKALGSTDTRRSSRGSSKPTELAVIGNVDPELAKEIGINTDKLDPEVAKAVTYMTQGKVKSDASEKLTKSIGRYMSDSIGYATRTLGEAGARTAESLIRGSKVKSDIKSEVRQSMVNVMKLSKKVAGNTETSRVQVGKNLVDALEDRENADKYLTNPETKDLYNNIVSIFDNIKQKMIDNGMPVRENYSPWNMLKDYSDSPSYLESGLTDKKTRVVSGNAQERTVDEKPPLTNNNILEVLPRYVDGMINHIAFTPVLDDFSSALENMPAHIRANTSQFNDGIQYLNKMLSNGISQGSSSTADKWIKGLQNNSYNGFLWNNPKNASFALAQKLLAVGDINKDGREIASQFDKDDLNIVDSKAWFGDRSVSADIAGGDDAATKAGQALRGSKFGQAMRKYDINRWGEQKSIEGPFRQAFAQGLSESDAYRTALASGKSSKEAIKIALKDPAALAQGERSGNIQVNNTAFGANSLARPEFLRDSSAIKRAVTMFMRFPLGISNFVRDTIQIKDARALDVIQRGDPRATSIANMRGEYKAYLKGLNDVRDAIKSGKAPADAPSAQVIDDHIKLVQDNVKTIDNTIKNLSSLRGNKRVAALAGMWAATAAIQFAWDGIASGIDNSLGGNDTSPTVSGSIGKTDPTIISLINPWNDNSKVRAGFNSPLNPISKYGKVSSRSALNLIPGAGAINRLSGNRISDFIDAKIAGK